MQNSHRFESIFVYGVCGNTLQARRWDGTRVVVDVDPREAADYQRLLGARPTVILTLEVGTAQPA